MVPTLKSRAPVLFVIGFHRSMTSATAAWLHRAGINMGYRLLPPHPSNPDGHFEDDRLVNLQQRMLCAQGTDWRFHEEVSLDPRSNPDLLRRYIRYRDAAPAEVWGAKDPRSCLFLPAWQEALEERARYLVVLRHWSASLYSLLRRHRFALDNGLGDATTHRSMLDDICLGARMWESYNRRLLKFVARHPTRALCITQQSLLGGLDLPEQVKRRLGVPLDSSAPSPIDASLGHDNVPAQLLDCLPTAMCESLESLWSSVLSLAQFRTDSETPQYVRHLAWQEAPQPPLDPPSSPTDPTAASTNDVLSEQLDQLIDWPKLGLDIEKWDTALQRQAERNPNLWNKLYTALARRGRIEEAARVFENKVARLATPFAWNLLGFCREADFQDPQAEQAYLKAIELNPAHAGYRANLARLWLSQGALDRSRNFLGQAMKQLGPKPRLVQLQGLIPDE